MGFRLCCLASLGAAYKHSFGTCARSVSSHSASSCPARLGRQTIGSVEDRVVVLMSAFYCCV